MKGGQPQKELPGKLLGHAHTRHRCDSSHVTTQGPVCVTEAGCALLSVTSKTWRENEQTPSQPFLGLTPPRVPLCGCVSPSFFLLSFCWEDNSRAAKGWAGGALRVSGKTLCFFSREEVGPWGEVWEDLCT